MSELNTSKFNADTFSYADITAGRASPCHFDTSQILSTLSDFPSSLVVQDINEVTEKVQKPRNDFENRLSGSSLQLAIDIGGKGISSRMSRLDQFNLQNNEVPAIFVDNERNKDTILQTLSTSQSSSVDIKLPFQNQNVRQPSFKVDSQNFLNSETKRSRSKSPFEILNKKITEGLQTNPNKQGSSQSLSHTYNRCIKQGLTPTKLSNYDSLNKLLNNSKARSISPINRQNRSIRPLGLCELTRVNQTSANLLTVEPLRCRSKSPVWIPGESASYSDIVKGNSCCNSRIASLEDLTETGKSVLESDFDTTTNNKISDSRNSTTLEDETKQQTKNTDTKIQNFGEASVESCFNNDFDLKTIKNEQKILKRDERSKLSVNEEIFCSKTSDKAEKKPVNKNKFEASYDIVDELLPVTCEPAIFVTVDKEIKDLNSYGNQKKSVLATSAEKPYNLCIIPHYKQTVSTSIEDVFTEASNSPESSENKITINSVPTETVRLPSLTSGYKRNTTLLTIEPRRSRSKSPIWIPGLSASYSDMVKGNSRCNSRVPSLEDLTELDKPVIEPQELKSEIKYSPVVLSKHFQKRQRKKTNTENFILTNEPHNSPSINISVSGCAINQAVKTEVQETVSSNYSKNDGVSSAKLPVECVSREEVVQSDIRKLCSDNFNTFSDIKVDRFTVTSMEDISNKTTTFEPICASVGTLSKEIVFPSTSIANEKIEGSANDLIQLDLCKKTSVKTKIKTRCKKQNIIENPNSSTFDIGNTSNDCKYKVTANNIPAKRNVNTKKNKKSEIQKNSVGDLAEYPTAQDDYVLPINTSIKHENSEDIKAHSTDCCYSDSLISLLCDVKVINTEKDSITDSTVRIAEDHDSSKINKDIENSGTTPKGKKKKKSKKQAISVTNVTPIQKDESLIKEEIETVITVSEKDDAREETIIKEIEFINTSSSIDDLAEDMGNAVGINESIVSAAEINSQSEIITTNVISDKSHYSSKTDKKETSHTSNIDTYTPVQINESLFNQQNETVIKEIKHLNLSGSISELKTVPCKSAESFDLEINTPTEISITSVGSNKSIQRARTDKKETSDAAQITTEFDSTTVRGRKKKKSKKQKILEPIVAPNLKEESVIEQEYETVDPVEGEDIGGETIINKLNSFKPSVSTDDLGASISNVAEFIEPINSAVEIIIPSEISLTNVGFDDNNYNTKTDQKETSATARIETEFDSTTVIGKKKKKSKKQKPLEPIVAPNLKEESVIKQEYETVDPVEGEDIGGETIINKLNSFKPSFSDDLGGSISKVAEFMKPINSAVKTNIPSEISLTNVGFDDNNYNTKTDQKETSATAQIETELDSTTVIGKKKNKSKKQKILVPIVAPNLNEESVIKQEYETVNPVEGKDIGGETIIIKLNSFKPSVSTDDLGGSISTVAELKEPINSAVEINIPSEISLTNVGFDDNNYNTKTDQKETSATAQIEMEFDSTTVRGKKKNKSKKQKILVPIVAPNLKEESVIKQEYETVNPVEGEDIGGKTIINELNSFKPSVSTDDLGGSISNVAEFKEPINSAVEINIPSEISLTNVGFDDDNYNTKTDQKETSATAQIETEFDSTTVRGKKKNKSKKQKILVPIVAPNLKEESVIKQEYETVNPVEGEDIGGKTIINELNSFKPSVSTDDLGGSISNVAEFKEPINSAVEINIPSEISLTNVGFDDDNYNTKTDQKETSATAQIETEFDSTTVRGKKKNKSKKQKILVPIVAPNLKEESVIKQEYETVNPVEGEDIGGKTIINELNSFKPSVSTDDLGGSISNVAEFKEPINSAVEINIPSEISLTNVGFDDDNYNTKTDQKETSATAQIETEFDSTTVRGKKKNKSKKQKILVPIVAPNLKEESVIKQEYETVNPVEGEDIGGETIINELNSFKPSVSTDDLGGSISNVAEFKEPINSAVEINIPSEISLTNVGFDDNNYNTKTDQKETSATAQIETEFDSTTVRGKKKNKSKKQKILVPIVAPNLKEESVIKQEYETVNPVEGEDIGGKTIINELNSFKPSVSTDDLGGSISNVAEFKEPINSAVEINIPSEISLTNVGFDDDNFNTKTDQKETSATAQIETEFDSTTVKGKKKNKSKKQKILVPIVAPNLKEESVIKQEYETVNPVEGEDIGGETIINELNSFKPSVSTDDLGGSISNVAEFKEPINSAVEINIPSEISLTNVGFDDNNYNTKTDQKETSATSQIETEFDSTTVRGKKKNKSKKQKPLVPIVAPNLKEESVIKQEYETVNPVEGEDIGGKTIINELNSFKPSVSTDDLGGSISNVAEFKEPINSAVEINISSEIYFTNVGFDDNNYNTRTDQKETSATAQIETEFDSTTVKGKKKKKSKKQKILDPIVAPNLKEESVIKQEYEAVDPVEGEDLGGKTIINELNSFKPSVSTDDLGGSVSNVVQFLEPINSAVETNIPSEISLTNVGFDDNNYNIKIDQKETSGTAQIETEFDSTTVIGKKKNKSKKKKILVPNVSPNLKDESVIEQECETVSSVGTGVGFETIINDLELLNPPYYVDELEGDIANVLQGNVESICSDFKVNTPTETNTISYKGNQSFKTGEIGVSNVINYENESLTVNGKNKKKSKKQKILVASFLEDESAINQGKDNITTDVTERECDEATAKAEIVTMPGLIKSLNDLGETLIIEPHKVTETNQEISDDGINIIDFADVITRDFSIVTQKSIGITKECSLNREWGTSLYSDEGLTEYTDLEQNPSQVEQSISENETDLINKGRGGNKSKKHKIRSNDELAKSRSLEEDNQSHIFSSFTSDMLEPEIAGKNINLNVENLLPNVTSEYQSSEPDSNFIESTKDFPSVGVLYEDSVSVWEQLHGSETLKQNTAILQDDAVKESQAKNEVFLSEDMKPLLNKINSSAIGFDKDSSETVISSGYTEKLLGQELSHKLTTDILFPNEICGKPSQTTANNDDTLEDCIDFKDDLEPLLSEINSLTADFSRPENFHRAFEIESICQPLKIDKILVNKEPVSNIFVTNEVIGPASVINLGEGFSGIAQTSRNIVTEITKDNEIFTESVEDRKISLPQQKDESQKCNINSDDTFYFKEDPNRPIYKNKSKSNTTSRLDENVNALCLIEDKSSFLPAETNPINSDNYSLFITSSEMKKYPEKQSKNVSFHCSHEVETDSYAIDVTQIDSSFKHVSDKFNIPSTEAPTDEALVHYDSSTKNDTGLLKLGGAVNELEEDAGNILGIVEISNSIVEINIPTGINLTNVASETESLTSPDFIKTIDNEGNTDNVIESYEVISNENISDDGINTIDLKEFAKANTSHFSEETGKSIGITTESALNRKGGTSLYSFEGIIGFTDSIRNTSQMSQCKLKNKTDSINKERKKHKISSNDALMQKSRLEKDNQSHIFSSFTSDKIETEIADETINLKVDDSWSNVISQQKSSEPDSNFTESIKEFHSEGKELYEDSSVIVGEEFHGSETIIENQKPEYIAGDTVEPYASVSLNDKAFPLSHTKANEKSELADPSFSADETGAQEIVSAGITKCSQELSSICEWQQDRAVSSDLSIVESYSDSSKLKICLHNTLKQKSLDLTSVVFKNEKENQPSSCFLSTHETYANVVKRSRESSPIHFSKNPDHRDEKYGHLISKPVLENKLDYDRTSGVTLADPCFSFDETGAQATIIVKSAGIAKSSQELSSKCEWQQNSGVISDLSIVEGYLDTSKSQISLHNTLKQKNLEDLTSVVFKTEKENLPSSCFLSTHETYANVVKRSRESSPIHFREYPEHEDENYGPLISKPAPEYKLDYDRTSGVTLADPCFSFDKTGAQETVIVKSAGIAKSSQELSSICEWQQDSAANSDFCKQKTLEDLNNAVFRSEKDIHPSRCFLSTNETYANVVKSSRESSPILFRENLEHKGAKHDPLISKPVTEYKVDFDNTSVVTLGAFADPSFSDEKGVQEIVAVKSAGITKSSQELSSICEWQQNSADISDLSIVEGYLDSSKSQISLDNTLKQKNIEDLTSVVFKTGKENQPSSCFLSTHETYANVVKRSRESSPIHFRENPEHENETYSPLTFKPVPEYKLDSHVNIIHHDTSAHDLSYVPFTSSLNHGNSFVGGDKYCFPIKKTNSNVSSSLDPSSVHLLYNETLVENNDHQDVVFDEPSTIITSKYGSINDMQIIHEIELDQSCISKSNDKISNQRLESTSTKDNSKIDIRQGQVDKTFFANSKQDLKETYADITKRSRESSPLKALMNPACNSVAGHIDPPCQPFPVTMDTLKLRGEPLPWLSAPEELHNDLQKDILATEESICEEKIEEVKEFIAAENVISPEEKVEEFTNLNALPISKDIDKNIETCQEELIDTENIITPEEKIDILMDSNAVSVPNESDEYIKESQDEIMEMKHDDDESHVERIDNENLEPKSEIKTTLNEMKDNSAELLKQENIQQNVETRFEEERIIKPSSPIKKGEFINQELQDLEYTAPKELPNTEPHLKTKLSSTTPLASVETISSQDEYTIDNVEVNIGIGFSQSESLDDANTVDFMAEVGISTDDNLSQNQDIGSFETSHSETVSEEIGVSKYKISHTKDTKSEDIDELKQVSDVSQPKKVGKRKKLRKETHVDTSSPEKNVTAVVETDIAKSIIESLGSNESSTSLPESFDIKKGNDSDGKLRTQVDSSNVTLEASGVIHHTETTDDAKDQMILQSYSTGGIVESLESISNIQEEGASSHMNVTILQPVIHQVRRTKKTIRKVVIINGKEHVSETVIEEPEQVISSTLEQEQIPFSDELASGYKSLSYSEINASRQIVMQSRKTITKTVKMINGKVLLEETESMPSNVEIVSIEEPSISIVQFDEDKSTNANEETEERPIITEVPEESKDISDNIPSSIHNQVMISSEEISVDNADQVVHISEGNEVGKMMVDLRPSTSDALSKASPHFFIEEISDENNASVVCSQQQDTMTSSGTIDLSSVGTQEKTIPAKSVSLGSDSSDSYYTDIQVKVTVPKELSLSVDIKHPKEKKKSRKNKNKNNEKDDISDPYTEKTSNVTVKNIRQTKAEKNTSRPTITKKNRLPEESKSSTAQFLNSEIYNYDNSSMKTKEFVVADYKLENTLAQQGKHDVTDTSISNANTQFGYIERERKNNGDQTLLAIAEIEPAIEPVPQSSESDIKNIDIKMIRQSEEVYDQKQMKANETAIQIASHSEKSKTNSSSKKESDKTKNVEIISREDNLDSTHALSERAISEATSIRPYDSMQSTRQLASYNISDTDITVKLTDEFDSIKEAENVTFSLLKSDASEETPLIEEAKIHIETTNADKLIKTELITDVMDSNVEVIQSIETDKNIKMPFTQQTFEKASTIAELLPRQEDKLGPVQKSKKGKSKKVQQIIKKSGPKDTSGKVKDITNKKDSSSLIDIETTKYVPEPLIKSNKEIPPILPDCDKPIQPEKEIKKRKSKKNKNQGEVTNKEKLVSSFATATNKPPISSSYSSIVRKNEDFIGKPNVHQRDSISVGSDHENYKTAEEIDNSFAIDDSVIDVSSSEVAEKSVEVHKNLSPTVTEHDKDLRTSPNIDSANEEMIKHEKLASNSKESDYQLEVTTSVQTDQDHPIVSVIKSPLSDLSTKLIVHDDIVTVSVVTDNEKVISTKEVTETSKLGISIPSDSHGISYDTQDTKFEIKPSRLAQKTFKENTQIDSSEVLSKELEALNSKHPDAKLSKSNKEISDDLLQTIKERTLNINTPSFVGLLSDLDNAPRRKEINHNLDLLKNSGDEEKESIIVTTIILISEYLETITYIIINSKKYDRDISSLEDKLQQISNLLYDLNMLKDDIACLRANGCEKELLSALETQANGVKNILDSTGETVNSKAAERQEILKRCKNILTLIQNLSEDIENLEKDQSISAEKKLSKLDKLEISNADYETQVSMMLKQYSTLPDLITSSQLLCVNEELLSGLRMSLIQSQALAQEYRDTLEELENVSEVAKTIVASRVIVPSLQDLQNEMQKERKFFVSLSHCRSILESLESSLDQETRTATAKLHSRLHNIASEVLESAGERAVALALGASRWTLLEQGLAEERGWLRVAQERLPNLSGVSSSDYHQFLSLYQSLMCDVELHSARIWKLLETAHTLQGLISCNGLEESCEVLRTTVGHLEDQVSENVKKLAEFKDIWSAYESSYVRLSRWLDNVITNYTPPLDIQAYWELKAEYEVQKSAYSDVCLRFKNAMKILPVTDKSKQMNKLKQLNNKWDILNKRLEEVEVSIPSDLSSGERLEIIETRLKQMEASINNNHDMTNEEELDLYIGKLQVLKEGAVNIENELLCYGLGPASERRKLASLQGRTRSIKTQSSGEHGAAVSLRDSLAALRNSMTRVARIQGKALKVLDQWEPTIDGGEDVVRQALVNVKGVVKTLCDERMELSWIRETLNRLPLGLRAGLSLINLEKEISTLSETHVSLSNRAEDLLALILSRLQLWDSYGVKLETVRSTVREADYMMELLRIDVGPIDLPRIVKASTRIEGVKESLTEREGGLEELRSASQSLETVVRPEVGERLRSEVREEEAAWARAEAGLGELASRYQRAAKLWAQYREAVSAADFPPVIESLSIEEWEKKQEAVKQVQQLAEEIAQETGVAGILSSEVNLLAKKLTDAKEIVTPSPVEPATQLRAQLIEAIQQNLNRYPEGSTTEQLVSLRNSLLDLGKTDAQLNSLASSSHSGDIPLSDLLQLCETAFRKNFKQYHQLSTEIVKSQDSATVINLWKDYLIHVNHFLEAELPQHYHELHEHNHLCQVHHTVLSSQKSLLPTESAAFDYNTNQQLNLLTNMHNETLAKIMEKQKQIETRILIWDKYRQDQSNLLDWLRRMEKERNQLKLRYINCKTVGNTITKIEELLNRMVEGESLEIALKEQLLVIIPFCDESVASSLQIEHASLSHRLSNLHAALLTWKDYLEKVKYNVDIYEKQVGNVENSLDKIKNILAAEKKFVVGNEDQKYLESKLQEIMTVLNHVKDLSKEVNSLEEAKDVLKDCLNPADLKSMSQRCWLFSQQQNEFEHQLTIAEHVINDKLQLSKIYEQRASRFLTWLSSMSHKLSTLPNDATSALSVLEREIRAEVALKRSEADWLIMTGQEIRNTETLNKVTEGWSGIQESLSSITEKLIGIAEGIPKLAEEMDNIRIWLHKVETILSTPIELKQTNKKYIASKIKEHKNIQDEIEKQRTKIKDVLNFCESLLNDCESCNITLDVEAITFAVANLENRWKEICANSSQRKISLDNLTIILEKARKLSEEQKIWLSELEKRIVNIKNHLRLSSLSMLPDIEENIIKLIADLNSGNSGELSSLDTIYLSLHSEYILPEEIFKIPENLLKKWEELKAQANELSIEIRSRGADREQWTRSAAKAVSAMAKVDALLTLAEVQESQEIEEIEKILQNECETLREADLCGLNVMKWCCDEDISKIQATIDEYQTLWKDINERLNKIKIRLEDENEKTMVQFEDQSVEVNTLKFETDRSTQVDTLGWSPPLARKGAFSEELIKTTEELEGLLTKLADLSYLETQAEISKCIGECESNYELAKHLSETLIEQCSASREEALVERVKCLGERFESLRVCALKKQNQLRETSARGRLTCPLCSHKNWQQLDNDLWRLEQWLQYAEGSLSSQPSNPPSSIEQLEDVIQDQRELLLDLDSHRSLVVSMNIVGTHLAEHSEDEVRARELRNRLTATNKQWEHVVELASAWQAKLQTALMQNQEFHDTMTELSDWLEKTETSIRQAEPIDLTDPTQIIEAKNNRFKEMQEEIERCEARVISLEEAARQVLPEEDRAVLRIGRLRLRLVSLSRLIASYINSLSATLGQHPPHNLPPLNLLSQQLLDNATPGSEQPTSGDGVDTSTLLRCHRFLGRVMRASLPISAFLLLLLGAASFIPVVEQDFTCANSFPYNMAPILRYPNGRPPI